MGNTSFISYQDQTISSLNLSDGSLRWIHSIDPFGYVFDIDVSDDGKVVVVTDEGILIFDE